MIDSTRRAIPAGPTEQPRAGVELLESRLMLSWSGHSGSNNTGAKMFLIQDPCHPDDTSKQALVIMGTNNADSIQINQVGTSSRFEIKINGRTMGNFGGSDGSHGGSGSGSSRHRGKDGKGGSYGASDRGHRDYGSRGSCGSRGGSGSHGGSGSDGNGGTIIATGDIERVIVYGCGGNDDIKVSQNTRVSTWLFGGAGNDKLRGGKGGDVIDGGNGDDQLSGYDGRDMIIGGDGKDGIVGDKHDDILIAGYTAYDGDGCPDTKDLAGANLGAGEDRWAYCKIMDEWTRTDLATDTDTWGVLSALDQYNLRVFHLFTGIGGLNEDAADRDNDGILVYQLNTDDPDQLNGPTTVFDDGDKDCLTGSGGLDWFLYNADIRWDPGEDGIIGTSDDVRTTADVITDLALNEFAQDIDFLLT